MGYLFSGLALAVGAVKGYCGKRTSGYIKNQRDAMLISLVRMLLCVLFGAVIFIFGGGLSDFSLNLNMLAVSLISGIANALFVLSWLVSVRKSAFMLVEIFTALGTFYAIACSAIFFKETVNIRQIIGLAGLLAAVVLMCSYNNSFKTKLTLGGVAILLLCGFSSGMADFSQKLFVKLCPNEKASVFNFYTYAVSAVVLFALYLLFSRGGNENYNSNETRKTVKGIIGYLAVMAVALYLNTYFKTRAAAILPAAQLYSMLLGATLIINTTMSAVAFNERVTLKSAMGIVTAFLSLLLINL